MSHDLYGLRSKGAYDGRTAEAVSRKCRLDAEDEERALSIYDGMLDALADRIALRSGPKAVPPVVYIAAYQHCYGVDLSAHASRDEAEARLLSIAWQQCMSDASIRAAVDARFGPLVADEPPLEHPFEADLHGDSGYGDEREERDEATSFSISAAESDAGGESSLASGAASFRNRGDGGRDDGTMGVDPDRGRRRRTFCEQLLEEWPQLARGEALWIVECPIVDEDEPSRYEPELVGRPTAPETRTEDEGSGVR